MTTWNQHHDQRGGSVSSGGGNITWKHREGFGYGMFSRCKSGSVPEERKRKCLLQQYSHLKNKATDTKMLGYMCKYR